VPSQQCVRRNEVGNFVQYSTADKVRFRRQAATLIICKPQAPRAQLLSQDPILFAQISRWHAVAFDSSTRQQR
jgi:hypothetical protein